MIKHNEKSRLFRAVKLSINFVLLAVFTAWSYVVALLLNVVDNNYVYALVWIIYLVAMLVYSYLLYYINRFIFDLENESVIV